jgi:hypothetical protein
MITRNKQRIKNRPGNAFGTSGSRLFRLSATMVELSLGHNQLDSPRNVPATLPIKPEYSAQAKNEFSATIAAKTEQQENKAAQPRHSGLQASRELFAICISRISADGAKFYSWLKRIAANTGRQESKAAQPHHSGLQASRELLRICISRIRADGVTFYSWLKSRMRLSAACSAAILLTLLAFGVVHAVRSHHADSVKSQSQPPAAVEQHVSTLASSSASEQTHDNAHTVAPDKVKSRRRQDDYIAKDTYVYYGKDGKPSH